MAFAHTLAPKRDIVTTRSSVLFHSYKTLVRFWHYSDSLSFHSFKRPSLSQSRNALHSRRSHYTNPDPHTVIFHCVICFLRSNLPRVVLPSQPISHTVQAAFAFTFPIVFNAVVFDSFVTSACSGVLIHPVTLARTWRTSSRLLHQPVRSSFNSYSWQFYYLVRCFELLNNVWARHKKEYRDAFTTVYYLRLEEMYIYRFDLRCHGGQTEVRRTHCNCVRRRSTPM